MATAPRISAEMIWRHQTALTESVATAKTAAGV
jgi:hypothetical protein